MKKEIIAYQISGQTVGIDLTKWYKDDLNGNKPFNYIESGSTMPENYVSINTIENWDAYGYEFANDYAVVKFGIKNIVDELGWSALTNVEKDLAIKYYCYSDPINPITYLMTEKGMSQAEATYFLTQTWHKHHLKNIEAYRQRWNYAKFTVLQYLNRSDGEDLFNTVKSLIDMYIEVGVLGIDFNDNNDGIIDYVFSINGFSGQGLEENNYLLLQGTWEQFKSDIYTVLVDGIYEKY